MRNANIITPADVARIAKAASDKADEHALLVARAMIEVASELFREFRPTIDGALEALRDLGASLVTHGTSDTPGSTWSRIMSKIDELTEESPNTNGK